MSILTYRPGEIRYLQDVALANRLTDFINTEDSFDKNYWNPLLAARRQKNRLLNAADNKANKITLALEYIVLVLLLFLPFGLFFSPSMAIRGIGAVIQLTSVVLFFILFVTTLIKTPYISQKVQNIFYQKELKKKEAEIRSCDEAIAAAEKKYNEASQRPEIRILKEFLRHEGSELSHNDLLELRRIVVQGYARDFAQARTVLSQKKHNEKMEDIAEQRRKQELQHQRAMEHEAEQQRIAQQEHYRQQQQHNREQARANQQTNSAVEKAANAVYDYYHKY